jgi:hypothetical protein
MQGILNLFGNSKTGAGQAIAGGRFSSFHRAILCLTPLLFHVTCLFASLLVSV